MNLAEKKNLDHFNYDVLENDRLELYRQQLDQAQDSFAEDVADGLNASPKKLSPKYFYDDNGSRLFDQITRTKEYYPTRTEKNILNQYIDQIKAACPKISFIAELGSGTSDKTRIILESFLDSNNKVKYVPIDVSDILISSSQSLLHRYPGLSITGIVSDYEAGLELLSEFDDVPKLIIFLGSSIGNFNRSGAEEMLRSISDSMGKADRLLVGFDLVKPVDVLHAAYNDAQGYTAAFNMNLLHRINRELDADFNIEGFDHKAFFNSLASRIEMHLVSNREQSVAIKNLNQTYTFRKGETIHTENSHKFNADTIAELAQDAGLKVQNSWTDRRKYFSLSLFSPV